MKTYDYDLFVIGGGSGGVRAARVAASKVGVRVALAEEDRYGGTCVIRGCVPKKLMVFASEFSSIPSLAKGYGWDCETSNFDWSVFRSNLNSELSRLEIIYRQLLKNSGVETFDARACVKSPNTIELSTGEIKTAKIILIATGGKPARPEIPNAEFGIVSDDIFNLKKLPKSILIVGGGYIACEFACIFNGLGVEVTQYYRGNQILRGFDNEARGIVAESMIENGINLHLDTNISEMGPVNDDNTGVEAKDTVTAVGAAAEIIGGYSSAGKDCEQFPICVKPTKGITQ